MFAMVKLKLIILFGIICLQHQISPAYLNGFFRNGKNTYDSRVIGGSNATRRQFPYMVAVHNNGNHLCGASVVSHSWVVTAAHCCDVNQGLNCAVMQVVAGQLNQFEEHPDVQKSLVDKVLIHPEYHFNGYEIDNDITLLRLASKLKFTDAVQPVTLPSANQVFTEGWLSGWGYYKRPPSLPVTLQWLKMDIITNDECKEILKNFNPLEQLPLLDSMVCSMPLTGGSETACGGDSGGPIAVDRKLIGIASWAVNCEKHKENAPSVFTDVRRYLDFIKENVDDLGL